jgi:uncharacterized protein (DUF362 family)
VTTTARSHTKVTVVKAKNRREGVRRSIELLGANPVKGKEAVLKPNFNTADPFPGSTHPDTLRELIFCLKEMGAKKITIGERSGPPKTAEVMEELGIYAMAAKLGVAVVNFDELPPEDLVRVDAPGSHCKDGFLVPRLLREAECVVATPCLKTHQFGGIFSMTLKLAVGIVPKAGNTFMPELHSSADIRKMISELNLGYRTDLIVLDGMEGFVEGGPMTGSRKRADLFLGGTDRIAVDAVGVAVLKELGSTPEIMESNIFDQEQIARAVELGLGIASPAEIELVTGDAKSAAYAQKIRPILDRG